MRIDAFNKVSQLYQTNKTQSVKYTKSTGFSDKLEISKTGKDYQIVKQALSQIPDVRNERVKEIKDKLESGNYNISAQELADKLVDSYFDETI